MNTFMPIAAILVISWLALFVGGKLRIPSVVTLIVTGIIIGLPRVQRLLVPEGTGFLVPLGDAGLICLMFLAGLETSGRKLLEEKKDASLIAIAGLAVPFILGFTVFLALGYSPGAALIVGVCSGITAEATKARVLLELDKLKTRVGSALITTLAFPFVLYRMVGNDPGIMA
ncbi:MAG: hypothetical protein GF392_04105 [Candidatus Omnitrophica bacterium]|nr:hypothetical protein [Candidatus Omnitrophota bacterium]